MPFAAAVCGGIGIIVAIAPHLWADWFSSDPEVLAIAYRYLHIVGPAYALLGLGMALPTVSTNTLAGMIDHVDFEEQTQFDTEEGALRPDLLVRLPGGRSLVVDAKAPLQAYLDALEATDEAVRAARIADHARQIRDHIAKLSKGVDPVAVEKIVGLSTRSRCESLAPWSRRITSTARRGAHAHRVTRQLVICVAGGCTFDLDDRGTTTTVRLDDPAQALLIEPWVWHEMREFTPDAVLLVLADTRYDEGDYLRDRRAYAEVWGGTR